MLTTATGRAVRAQYVLADGAVELAGHVVARDPVGVDLYRVNGPVVILTHVSGLYPNDTWSRRTVTYQRVECTGGTVAVELQGDAACSGGPRRSSRPSTGRSSAARGSRSRG